MKVIVKRTESLEAIPCLSITGIIFCFIDILVNGFATYVWIIRIQQLNNNKEKWELADYIMIIYSAISYAYKIITLIIGIILGLCNKINKTFMAFCWKFGLSEFSFTFAVLIGVFNLIRQPGRDPYGILKDLVFFWGAIVLANGLFYTVGFLFLSCVHKSKFRLVPLPSIEI